MTENKKTLLFSVLGVILLLVVVIGVSYAMYTFSANGSKENVISTGTVSVSYAETSTINLKNVYPSTDAEGSKGVEGVSQDLVFTVTSTVSNETTKINYEIALANVTNGTATPNPLTENYIKFNLKKGDEYVTGFGSANTGVLVSSIKGNAGTLVGTDGSKLITEYYLTSGTLTGNATETYTLRAWVADTYKLPQGANTTSEDGKTQTNASTAETFKFGVEIKAAA